MKKLSFTLLATVVALLPLSGQTLYDPGVIQEIKLSFYQSNWDHLLDSLKQIDNGDYLLAPSVEINGQMFDSVGVKYKGNSSYQANNVKNPLHIKLDFVRPDQNYQGASDLKLSNGFADPTFVREVLSYEILRKYMDAPLANYAKLYINGNYWGLYDNVESINKRFLRKHIKTDGDNPFFKCNPEDFGGPGTGGNYPNLVYSSTDSSFYYNKYDIQSDYGWQQLLTLMDTLKNHPAGAATVVDVDRALWMLAFNALLVNLDSYTGAFAQNYYLYYDRNDRFLPFAWDLNMSFGAFSLLNAGGPGNGLTITQEKQLDPFVQSTNSNRPLIKQLLANPTWKRMYIAHMRTMMQENFATDSYINRALDLQAVIDAAVQADPNKFYSYTSFKNNISQSVSAGPFGSIPGISDLMGGRVSFLSANASFTATPPTISEVQSSIGGQVFISARVQNATMVLLGWRADSSDVFQRIAMFDDGLHNDGASSDGVYGGSFPLEDARMQYYLYAENAAAGIFSPERAEHEFYIAKPVLPHPGDVVINELLASNTNGEVDEAGEYDDWMELYNNTASPVSLSGLYLSDDPVERNKWSIPAGVSIPGNGFLIFWMDGDELQGPYHAGFKLGVAGDKIIFSDGGDVVLDSIYFGQQLPDISFGRYPNGTGAFTFMPPTFNAVNVLTIKTSEPHVFSAVQVFPNPVRDGVAIRSDDILGNILLTNTQGKIMATLSADDHNEAYIRLDQLPTGVYFLTITNGTRKQTIRLVHL